MPAPVYNKQNFILDSLIKDDNIKCIISYKEYVDKFQIYITGKINSNISFTYDNGKSYGVVVNIDGDIN